jgi:hypothetical protein
MNSKQTSLYVSLIAGSFLAFSTTSAQGLTLGSPSANQPVFLDFVSNQDSGQYVYSSEEQTAILNNIYNIYKDFSYSFTLTRPTAGDFATLIFNAKDIGGGGESIGGIDIRNLDKNGTAKIDAIPLLGQPGGPELNSQNVVALSSTIGAHELGHLAGLFHEDSYGPIGSGIPSRKPLPGDFTPAYLGPTQADETYRHLMASPSSVGQTISEAVGSVFLGEREAVKLAFNEYGSVVSEQAGAHNSIATAHPLTLASLPVPNTLLAGQNVGKRFIVDAIAAKGELSQSGESDFYSFKGLANQLFNFEVFSNVSEFRNHIDPQISIFDSTGALVPYYNGFAVNDNRSLGGYEAPTNLDSMLFDLVLPKDDTYYVKINDASSSKTGDYELFMYDFAAVPATAVPEPSDFIESLVTGFGMLAIARFWRRQGTRKT